MTRQFFLETYYIEKFVVSEKDGEVGVNIPNEKTELWIMRTFSKLDMTSLIAEQSLQVMAFQKNDKEKIEVYTQES